MRIEGGWLEWKEVYIPCKKALRFFAGFFSSCWLLLPRFYCGWRRLGFLDCFALLGQMQAFETSYGGWSISAGPFVMQIQGGYFAPNAQLETVAKTAYSVESGMDLIAGACQWLVYFSADLLFEQARENPFTPEKAAVICAGSAHCYVLGLSCLNLAGPFYSVCWPVGSGRFSLADCLVSSKTCLAESFFAVSRIFDYGCALQRRI